MIRETNHPLRIIPDSAYLHAASVGSFFLNKPEAPAVGTSGFELRGEIRYEYSA